MDMNNFEKNITMFLDVFMRVLLYPFLMIFGSFSRVSYEYFTKQKIPTPKQISGIMTMGVFTSVLIFLLLKDMGVSMYRISAGVLAAGFMGHNLIIWIMENHEDLFTRILNKFGFTKENKDGE